MCILKTLMKWRNEANDQNGQWPMKLTMTMTMKKRRNIEIDDQEIDWRMTDNDNQDIIGRMMKLLVKASIIIEGRTILKDYGNIDQPIWQWQLLLLVFCVDNDKPCNAGENWRTDRKPVASVVQLLLMCVYWWNETVDMKPLVLLFWREETETLLMYTDHWKPLLIWPDDESQWRSQLVLLMTIDPIPVLKKLTVIP